MLQRIVLIILTASALTGSALALKASQGISTDNVGRDHVMAVSRILPGEDWDEYEICTSSEIVKLYGLEDSCKEIGF